MHALGASLYCFKNRKDVSDTWSVVIEGWRLTKYREIVIHQEVTLMLVFSRNEGPGMIMMAVKHGVALAHHLL